MNDEENVEEWLRFARHDSEAASYLFSNMSNPPLEIICFHCQQAAEKYLKGLITAKGTAFEKKHDLSYLLDLLGLKVAENASLYESATRLTPYGAAVRYPGDKETDLADTKLALSDMDRIERWVKEEFARMESQS